MYTENRVKGLKVAKWHKRRQKARKEKQEMKELEGKRGEMKWGGRVILIKASLSGKRIGEQLN